MELAGLEIEWIGYQETFRASQYSPDKNEKESVTSLEWMVSQERIPPTIIIIEIQKPVILVLQIYS